jgi:uncharacterized protein YciI
MSEECLLFVALCHDKPGALDLRMATRTAHLAFLDVHAERVKLGGPFVDAMDKPIGSMLILDCPDEAAARAMLAEDPYAKVGLFSHVEVQPWKRAVGAVL